ncbi:MAG: hypothetical protein ACREEL_11900 [Stellaceae bacterium]
MSRAAASWMTACTRRAIRALCGLPVLLAVALPAWAEHAHDWQISMQPAATPVRERIDALAVC